MKKLTCEMCGSNNLLKKDGVFVCQSCGTQYSVEEAKKLMVEVEGKVDVSGSTVKVDNSSKLKNLYESARRAKDTNNWEDAANYYRQITQQDASSWEAYFYSVYCSQMNCKIIQIASAANSISNAIIPTFNLIRKNVPSIDQHSAYLEVAKNCGDAATKLSTAANNFFTEHISTDEGEYKQRERACGYLEYKIACALEDFGEKEEALYYYKFAAIKFSQNHFTQSERDEITRRAKKLDPSYQAVEPIKGGCYVATCVYGSYDCPEVWTLRRYRDDTLDKTWYGRAFIKTYYTISPTAVRWFGKYDWFKNMFKRPLDKMINKLSAKGYENTPYNDKY